MTTAKPNDVILIGCDGVWDYLTDEKVKGLIAANRQNGAQATTNAVTKAVKEAMIRNGGGDNITVQAIRVPKRAMATPQLDSRTPF